MKRGFKAASSIQVREALPQDKLSRKAGPRRGKDEGLRLHMTTTRMSLGRGTRNDNKQALS